MILSMAGNFFVSGCLGTFFSVCSSIGVIALLDNSHTNKVKEKGNVLAKDIASLNIENVEPLKNEDVPLEQRFRA